jgi:S1-C subfamily serine protease/pimeloyl-ACP methyl ester carboxylesterase
MRDGDEGWLRRLVRRDLVRLERGPFASVGVVATAFSRLGTDNSGEGLLDQLDRLERAESQSLLKTVRPGIRLLDDRLATLPSYWQHLVGDRNRLARAAGATGKLVVWQAGCETAVGTGFLVAPGLIMTARHVAETFVQGVGARGLALRPGMDAVLRLAPGVDVGVASALLIHPYWDLAILAPTSVPSDRTPLTLVDAAPTSLAGREVAVIGFPVVDENEDAEGVCQLLGRHWADKHLQPGQVTGMGVVDSRWEPVEAVRTDARTMPGNSGSPVLDIEDGRVLGIHFAREQPAGGAAVPAWELARDPHVQALGLFGEREQLPAWLAHWSRVDQPAPRRREVGTLGPSVRLPGDWTEWVDDAFVARMLDADPEGTRALLREAWGDTLAEEMIAELGREPAGEGFGWPPKPLEDLPEIIFLHGIVGSHLDDGTDRVWFDPAGVIAHDMSRRLSLQPDGTTDAHGVDIKVTGHVQLIYGLAALRWRHARFRVTQLALDWRVSLDESVESLHAFMVRRRRAYPGRRFAFVGHSMGGLLALLYAARYPNEWRDHIDTAVLVGAPIAGALPAFESPTGTYSNLLRVAALSSVESRETLAAMVRTWPGSHDMLPAPEVFKGAADLYDPRRWPKGTAPDSRWLKRSKMLKPLLLNSPLLERAHLIAGIGHPTHGQLIRGSDGTIRVDPRREEGDAAVPLRSAVPEGRDGWVVRGLNHSFLMLIPSVVNAVPELILEGRCDLLPVSEGDYSRTFSPAGRPDPVVPGVTSPEPAELVAERERLAGVARRFRAGRAGVPDLLRLVLTPS